MVSWIGTTIEACARAGVRTGIYVHVGACCGTSRVLVGAWATRMLGLELLPEYVLGSEIMMGPEFVMLLHLLLVLGWTFVLEQKLWWLRFGLICSCWGWCFCCNQSVDHISCWGTHNFLTVMDVYGWKLRKGNFAKLPFLFTAKVVENVGCFSFSSVCVYVIHPSLSPWVGSLVGAIPY